MDYVWMSHPSLPGTLTRIPEASFYGTWEGKGWVLATPPETVVERDFSVDELEMRAYTRAVRIGPLDPHLTEPGLWVQTGLGDGTGTTIWIEDGN